MARKLQQGVSLVEMAVVTAIAAVLVGVAAPSFGPAIERRAIEGAAAQLQTDLQYARSLAVARNESVRVRFERSGSDSCYVVHTGGPDDCKCEGSGPAVCTGQGMEIRTVRFLPGQRLAVQSNVRTMLFDADKGTATPAGSISVSGASGATIKQVVNIMGRVRSCSPEGAPKMSGVPIC